MRFFDPRDAIPHVPAWLGQSVQVERELEGLSNRSFLVRCGDERYVLRLDGPQSAVFDTDRITEVVVHDRAAREGLAPAIVFADKGTGILVTRYLEGDPLDPAALGDAANIERIAELLRRVHGFRRCGRVLDLAGAARRYAAALDEAGDGRDTAAACVRVLDSAPPAERVVTCHNDVVAGNLIDADGLYLIDWEYARDNDPLFDVATLVAYHQLAPEVADAYLSAYLGGARPEDRERLAAFVRVCDALHWLWLAARARALPSHADHETLARLAQRIG